MIEGIMSMNIESRSITPRKTYVRELPDRCILEAEVSPCVFMYSGYPLQLTVTLRLADGSSGGIVYPSNPELIAGTATAANIRTLLETVGTIPCSRCSTPAF